MNSILQASRCIIIYDTEHTTELTVHKMIKKEDAYIDFLIFRLFPEVTVKLHGSTSKKWP